MAKKVLNDESFDSEYDMTDDGFEIIEIEDVISTIKLDARRRLEIIMEDKELERLTDSSYSYYF